MTTENKNPAAARAGSDASMAQAVAHLLHPSQLQESAALAPPVSLRIAVIAGVQAAFSALTAIVLALVSPWPQLVGFTALGALVALYGRFDTLARRRRIVAICGVLMTLSVLLPTLAAWGGAPAWALVLILALVAGGATVAVSRSGLGAPGAAIIVFAAGAALRPVAGVPEMAAQVLATAAGALVAWLVCWITDSLRSEELRQLRLAPVKVPPWSHQLIAAARIALGAGIAAAMAWAAGWAHPAWAAIGAITVMQGTHLHVTMSRALQRMAGTVVGAFIVWLILAQQPPLWLIVAVIVVFQFLTEVLMGFNYALGQVTVTPMALLMTALASPLVVQANMPVERVLETMLGAAVGIVLAVLFSSVDDRVHLAELRRKKG